MIGGGDEPSKGNGPDASLGAQLAILETAGVPLDRILRLGEREGMSAWDLVQWTEGFLNRLPVSDSKAKTMVLVFGCIRDWQPLLPSLKEMGVVLLKSLLLSRTFYLRDEIPLTKGRFTSSLRTRILQRLGYPICLRRSLTPKLSEPDSLREAMTWLGNGQPVCAQGLKLQGFKSSAPKWGVIYTPDLVLKDGHGPEQLDLNDANDLGLFPWLDQSTLRVEHVSGLLRIPGFSMGKAVVRHCPDLTSMPTPWNDLQVESCPNLTTLAVGLQSDRLIIKDCRNLESILIWSNEDWYEGIPVSERVSCVKQCDIEACGVLQHLPPRLRVEGNLRLTKVGGIKEWPWDFQVGGDFLIRDCPGLKRLPPVEVQGSLVIRGDSGLRCLSPGIVIGKHLDLRNCQHLETIPAGLKVGGSIRLPEHLILNTPGRPKIPVTEPFLHEEGLPDFSQDLRTILMGFHFSALVPSVDRGQIRDLAEQALVGLQARLRDDPGLESLILWTASDLWFDLSERALDMRNPWVSEGDWLGDDLPFGWFLELMRNDAICDPRRSLARRDSD